jgi:TonB family protein
MDAARRPKAGLSIGAMLWTLVLGTPAVAMAACDQITWVSLPSADDMAEVYPQRAWIEGREGRAMLHCMLAPDGELHDCSADVIQPDVYGFGPAALAIAGKLKAAPCGSERDPPFRINLPLAFKLPPGPLAREAMFKDPGQYMPPAGPYWPDKAYRVGAQGMVLADCEVAADNRLRKCKVIADTNPNYGFSDAVLKMAQVGFMTAAPLAPGASVPPDNVWRFRVVFAPTRRLPPPR